MNFAASDFASKSLNEQKALSLLFCNLFATQSRRWLLYFSEWTLETGELTSNAQASQFLNPEDACYNRHNADFLGSQKCRFYNIYYNSEEINITIKSTN